MPTAEATLRARTLQELRRAFPRAQGVLLWGNPASAMTGPGRPDLYGIARGRFLALELKKGRAKPTPIQERYLRDLRQVGAYAWIVRTAEQAFHAVYWTLKGWTRPMPEQPLDLGDWLMGGNAQPESAGPFVPDQSAPPLGFLPNPSRASDPADVFEVQVPPRQDEPEPDTQIQFDFNLVGAAIEAGIEIEGTSNGAAEPEYGRDYARIEDQERAAIRAEDETPLVTIAPSAALDKLDADLRTVGDRVSMAHERLSENQAVLQRLYELVYNVDVKLSKLMEAVFEDPGEGAEPEPPPPTPTRRRRSRGKKEFEVTSEQPAQGEASQDQTDPGLQLTGNQ